jgi:hypothetical protein
MILIFDSYISSDFFYSLVVICFNYFLMDRFILPDNQLLSKEQTETEELPVISQRIQDIIEVLNNFKELGDHERWFGIS